jgi:hypothetical protein
MGHVCLGGMSMACGMNGQPCCQNDDCGGMSCCAPTGCLGDGQFCGGVLNNCNGGQHSCSGCGGGGQNCCQGHNGNADFCTQHDQGCNPGGQCAPCGMDGQVACNGRFCDSDCADDQRNCIKMGDPCPGNNGTCTGGACSNGPCGGLGEACCMNGGTAYCVASYTECDNTKHCVGCGGPNQPCCDGHNGGWCAEQLTCSGNQCVPCGDQGLSQPCCPGDVCTNGNCQGGTCQ